LHQARQDLAAVRLSEGLPSSFEEPIEELDEAPWPYLSQEHRRLRAADERRRRGLGPEPTHGVIPRVSETAQLILAADRKRRGLDPPEFDAGPPQTAPLRTTAEEIIAAYESARQK
jgi:hypothetical protein